MKIVDFQEIMKEKFKRQDAIPQLERHYHGHCIHIGKISPGCRKCFTGEPGIAFHVGEECMQNCTYCYYHRGRVNENRVVLDDKLTSTYRTFLKMDFYPVSYSLQSSGETLMYINEIEKHCDILNQACDERGIRPWGFVYTNGILISDSMLDRLEACRVDEIRFHVGASMFSDKVFKNIEKTVKRGFVATVENPSYPPHKKQIMEMLPRLNDLGVKHLDLIEVQITNFNKGPIAQEYPEARVYQDYFIQLYDEGLVYDVMEEVIAKGYNFSVLDCNSAVERCRNGEGKRVMMDPAWIEDAHAPYDMYDTTRR